MGQWRSTLLLELPSGRRKLFPQCGNDRCLAPECDRIPNRKQGLLLGVQTDGSLFIFAEVISEFHLEPWNLFTMATLGPTCPATVLPCPSRILVVACSAVEDCEDARNEKTRQHNRIYSWVSLAECRNEGMRLSKHATLYDGLGNR